MRFDRAVKKISRDMQMRDPGYAYEFLGKYGHVRYAEGLSKHYTWTITIYYCGGPLDYWNYPFIEDVEDTDDDYRNFVVNSLSALVDGYQSGEFIPMVVSYYKSSEDEPYCDKFECMIYTDKYDYEDVYSYFDADNVCVMVREVPWQDFCDVRRYMCTRRSYSFWSRSSGSADPVDYLVGPFPPLPVLPAAAA